jgi:lauroyl/myristoyl acyltransferase
MLQSPGVLAIEDAERVAIRVGSVFGVRASGEHLPSGSARLIAVLVGGHFGVLETQAPWYSSHGQKVTSSSGAANHLIRVILTRRAASQAAAIG